jgi:hypothetical protein
VATLLILEDAGGRRTITIDPVSLEAALDADKAGAELAERIPVISRAEPASERQI